MDNKKFLLLPLLLSIYFCLFLYSNNIGQVPLLSMIQGTFICFAIAFSFLSIVKIFFKDKAKAGFIATILVFFFFSFGHFQSIISDLIIENLVRKTIFGIDNYVAKTHLFISYFILFIYIFLVIIFIIKITRADWNVIKISKILSVVVLFLMFMTLFRIGLYSATLSIGKNKNESTNDNYAKTAELPDIYYIILDGYGRQDVLSEFYGHDNSYFLDNLREKGFFVASDSHSNYAWTFLSLASSLNMEYINYLADENGRYTNDIRATYDLIDNNKVTKLLKSKGYTYVHFNSTWGATLKNSNADISINPIESGSTFVLNDEFIRMIIDATPLKLFNSYWSHNLANIYLNTFEKLRTIPSINNSTFTFVHILPPHHPYLFDRNGNIQSNISMLTQFQLNNEGGTKWLEKDKYIDQLMFVNKEISEITDILIAESSKPPIIIIQSDHGPQISNQQDGEYIRARLSNLIAIYFPNGGDEKLYNSITPVNIFRILTKYYLHEDIDKIEDREFYSEYVTPYDFIDVSKDFISH